MTSALLVGMGDQKADRGLVIDSDCMKLGSVSDLGKTKAKEYLEPSRTVLVDLMLGGGAEASFSPLWPYAAKGASKEGDRGLRDAVILMRQEGGRDFPRGFREALAKSLLASSRGGEAKPPREPIWSRITLPRLSVHAGISLLGHYWETRVLLPALPIDPASCQNIGVGGDEPRRQPTEEWKIKTKKGTEEDQKMQKKADAGDKKKSTKAVWREKQKEVKREASVDQKQGSALRSNSQFDSLREKEGDDDMQSAASSDAETASKQPAEANATAKVRTASAGAAKAKAKAKAVGPEARYHIPTRAQLARASTDSLFVIDVADSEEVRRFSQEDEPAREEVQKEENEHEEVEEEEEEEWEINARLLMEVQ